MTFKQYLEEEHKYQYVGTCQDSFEDHKCNFKNYSSISDFATGESKATVVSKVEFMKKVNVPEDLHLSKKLSYHYDKSHDVYIIYDEGSDVHYFFIK